MGAIRVQPRYGNTRWLQVEVDRDGDGWRATCPGLPGCTCRAGTERAALRAVATMAEDRLSLRVDINDPHDTG